MSLGLPSCSPNPSFSSPPSSSPPPPSSYSPPPPSTRKPRRQRVLDFNFESDGGVDRFEFHTLVDADTYICVLRVLKPEMEEMYWGYVLSTLHRFLDAVRHDGRCFHAVLDFHECDILPLSRVIAAYAVVKENMPVLVQLLHSCALVTSSDMVKNVLDKVVKVFPERSQPLFVSVGKGRKGGRGGKEGKEGKEGKGGKVGDNRANDEQSPRVCGIPQREWDEILQWLRTKRHKKVEGGKKEKE